MKLGIEIAPQGTADHTQAPHDEYLGVDYRSFALAMKDKGWSTVVDLSAFAADTLIPATPLQGEPVAIKA